MSRRPVLLSLVLLCAAPALPAAARTASLVADVNTSGAPEAPDDAGAAGRVIVLGSKVLFPNEEPSSGTELWVSDGSALGTRLVRDFCPGTCSTSFTPVGAAGGRGLFFAHDESSPGLVRLWASDGTRAGTFLFEPPGTSGPLRPCGLEESVTLGQALYFTAGDAAGCEIWRTDGTPEGTTVATDQSASTSESVLFGLSAAGDRLYFFSTAGGSGGRLLRLDADGGPAELVHPFLRLERLNLRAVVGTRLFLVADTAEGEGQELWVTDGTPEGTRALTSFAPSNAFEPTFFLKVIDGLVYFLADDVVGGTDLWQSDGTESGTRRVTDFGFASPFEIGFSSGQITKVGNRLLFLATDGLTGLRLWTSGGTSATPATTAPLAGCPGGCPELPERTRLVKVRNRALFAAADATHGTELWASDGTGPGTRPVRDLCPGLCSSDPAGITALGDQRRALFQAFDADGTVALWSSDGTRRGTVRLAGLGRDPFPSEVAFNPLVVGRRALFTVRDDDFVFRLWSSDGTVAGTGPIAPLSGAAPGSSPDELTAAGGELRFVACDGAQRAVFTSAGTPETTRPLSPTAGFCGSDRPRALVSVGDLTFFLLPDPGFGTNALWRTDGTDAGTYALAAGGPESAGDPVPYSGGVAFPVRAADGTLSLWFSDGTRNEDAPPIPIPVPTPGVLHTLKLVDLPAHLIEVRHLTAIGDRLYFAGLGPQLSDQQLWVTDGTATGTRQLTSLDRAFAFSDPPQITKAGDTVFFVVGDTFGPDLWKTDGTPGGTALVLPPSFEAHGKTPSGLIAFGGALYYFAATRDAPFRGLFRSDGTAAGTVLVAPVAAAPIELPGFGIELPRPVALSGAFYFAALTGDVLSGQNVELWRSDGTAAGTALVRDVNPGPASSNPTGLAAADGRLYFAATDAEHGTELWESDGTAGGTRLVQDLAPGPLSSHPRELTPAPSRLYFTADDRVHGREPWAYPLSGAGCAPSDAALCLGGRFRVEAFWRDFQGNTGPGRAAGLTADTGYFWFFDPANVEVVLKVLDGRGTNGHFWVFYGALSTVEYYLTVTDVTTGAARRYYNPSGGLASAADTAAFGPRGAIGSALSLAPLAAPSEAPLVAAGRSARQGSCAPSSTRLCLQGGRFAVEATWRDFQGNQGVGQAVPLEGGDTGYFWFFDDDNVEVVLKVLDGRPLNGKFWVFYGALSSVEYALTVTDTETGQRKEYRNPSGRLASFADTGAF